MIRLVLASASPARRRALIDAGVTPIVQVSNVDEETLTEQLGDIAPVDLALTLARAKAEDVARHFTGHDDAIIVGCDSVFELDGVAYGKPLTATVAVERIAMMSGRTGTLHTGHWVIRGGAAAGRTASTRLDFDAMTAAEIERYVASGEPLNVAGSFTLDGRSAPFIRRIDGDPSNVIGISLPTMRDLVHEVGGTWTELWATSP